jgi:hypothetical protein
MVSINDYDNLPKRAASPFRSTNKPSGDVRGRFTGEFMNRFSKWRLFIGSAGLFLATLNRQGISGAVVTREDVGSAPPVADIVNCVISEDSRHAAISTKDGSFIEFPAAAQQRIPGRIEAMAISADGQHIACAVSDRNSWSVLLDGRTLGAAFDSPSDFTQDMLALSPDGTHVACLVAVGLRYAVRLDDKQGGLFDKPMRFIDYSTGHQVYFLFSPDSRTCIYVRKSSGGALSGPAALMAGQQPIAGASPVEDIDGAEFSREGNHLAVNATEIQPPFTPVSRAILDGKTVETGSQTQWLLLDRAGAHLFAAIGRDSPLPAQRGPSPRTRDWTIDEDGKVVANLGQERGSPALAPPVALKATVSPDGLHLAYVKVDYRDAGRGQWPYERPYDDEVVRDGVAENQYPSVDDLRFSPNGQRLAYCARTAVVPENASASQVVVDGVKGPIFWH